jgi:N-acetylglucosamine kinase-like BadF-type ATPase
VFGLAGAGSSAIRDRLLDAIRVELSSTFTDLPPLLIETDARIALEGAFGAGPGVILIAGTGSIVLGKRADGEIIRVGGWGRVLGDEGSGYFLGLEALKAVSKEFDGLSEATLLKELFSARLGWTSRHQIIPAVYQEDFAIPSLAPLVLQAAGEGDPVSLDILKRASALVSQQVAAATKRINDAHKVRVVFVGGLIDHDTVYSAILRDTILNTIPDIEICPPERTPVEGAVLMAQQLLSKKG